MNSISSLNFLIFSCRIHEFSVSLSGKYWLWQLSEKLLEQCCRKVDIMKEALWISKVHRCRISIKLLLYLRHLCCVSRYSVNSLMIKSKEFHSNNALVHDQRNW